MESLRGFLQICVYDAIFGQNDQSVRLYFFDKQRWAILKQHENEKELYEVKVSAPKRI